MPFDDQDVHYEVFDQRLPNGLRVVVNPDPIAPGVAVNLWYRVGSSEEPLGATGFAHLFEHLMFAGSANVASGEHLAAIQAVGGSANATTSFDRTNYFETVGPHALELALWLEADRMSTLTVDAANLETQRDVVKEEKRQRYDNIPYGDQFELLLDLNFGADHPYGHPAIGSMADLDAATLNDVQNFYRRWYQPSGAVLTLSGPITISQAMELAERYFGSLPNTPVPESAQAPPLTPHTGHPELVVHREVPRPMLHLCWRTPALTHPDRLAVDLLLSVLGEGQASRLHRTMVRDQELAEGLGTYDLGLAKQASLAMITSRPREDVNLDQLIPPVFETLAAIADGNLDDRELERAKAGYEREWLAGLAPVEERADQLGFYTTHFDDPTRINSEFAEIQAVTADDISAVARRWFDPAAAATLRYEIQE